LGVTINRAVGFLIAYFEKSEAHMGNFFPIQANGEIAAD